MSDRLHFVSPLERAVFLRGLEQLRGADPQQVAVIAHSAEERFYRRGQTVAHPDRMPHSVQIIVNGTVVAEGDEHRGARLGPGDTLGGLTVLSRSEQGFLAVAETDVTTLEVEAEDIFEFYEDRFDVFAIALRNICRELLRLRSRIADGTVLSPRAGTVLPQRDLDLVERLVLMRRSGIFQRTSMDAIVRLARSLRELRFDAGTTLWRAGDASGYMFIVMEGRVSCRLPDGRTFFAGVGYPLGNLENHAREPRWYDAVVDEPIRVFRAESDTFYDVLEDHFEVALDFMASVAANLLRVSKELEATVPPAVQVPQES